MNGQVHETGGRILRGFAGIFITLAVLGVLGACSSKTFKGELEKIKAYDEKIQVKELPPEPQEVEASTAAGTEVVLSPETQLKLPMDKPLKPEKKKKADKKEKSSVEEKHLPEMEDGDGFVGRRPLVDPFKVGEKVTLAMSYFNIVAGYVDLEVLPFVAVNGQRSYSFRITARSNSFFSNFYKVDDEASTYLSHDTLLPFNFQIKVNEAKQIADIRSVFDWQKMKGNYWAKRIHKDKGERNKEIEWEIKPYSQNVISAIYYLRTFKLVPGKKLAFRVADEGKNIVFTADVLRREELATDLGKLKTVVVKPHFQVDGVFKPVGDIFIWLTDDERKFVVRIESKIKIGTLVGKLKSIDSGQ